MKYNKLIQYTMFLTLLLLVVACQNERLHELDDPVHHQMDSEGVVALTTARTDGVIQLAIDAPSYAQKGVWIDLNGDGRRAKDGAEDVKEFNIYKQYQLVAGVKSVVIYGDITYLAAASNQLTEVDIAKNPFLTTLHLSSNDLTHVDLSNNAALKVVDLSNNKISQISTEANRALESLWLFKNNLTELKLENNRALQFLDCSNNRLNQLDVSKNTDLRGLVVYNNHLTSLNVKQNSLLNKLWAFGNQIADTEVANLISSLGKTSNGKLWVSQEPLADHLVKQATSKGWHIE